MDRTFESGSAASPPSAPASPSTGYPTAGNPSLAIPATKPGPWWYHMINEELRAVISAAGITPDHEDVTQLMQAIQSLIASGGASKTPVRAATTANIASLAGGAPNTLDGVTLAANDRILVKDQATASQNGIYIVTTLGTGANGTWTRATDADGVGEIIAGMLVVSAEGTANADAIWLLTTNGTITVGTTALTFARQNGDASVSAKGIIQLASTAEAQAWADNTKALTPLRLAEALVGGNQSLGTSGYQKLPGGLIIQWFQMAKTTTASPVVGSWPIAFPSGVFLSIATIGGTANPNGGPISISANTAQATIYTTSGQAGGTILVVGIGA